MSLKDRFASINLLILNGELLQAEKALNAITPQAPVESRIGEHLRALIDFRRGRIQGARDRLIKAREEFGDNLNLLRDLAVCHYHLQNMLDFRLCLDQLERTLGQQESKLSNQSLFETELMLGKFLEEDARLAPALIFYDRALLRAAKPAHRVRALLQKARWQALYEPNQALSGLYRELISVPAESITEDLKIEFEHSLMLVELSLIGADHAWERYGRLSPDVPDIERRLIVFDFLEGALTRDLALSAEVLSAARGLKDLDPYEAYLRSLIFDTVDAPGKIKRLNQLASQLPWASYLRLLCLTANLEPHVVSKQELTRKIQLIIASLDSRSQTLWNARIKHALQTPEIRLEFSARSRSVVVQGKTIDLSKKKIGQQLLNILLKRPTLSVDQAIEHLWQSSFTPEHYHRLRMSIHRLNTLIHELSGHGKIIEVDSQEVRLRPEVRLKSADEAADSHLSLN